MCLKSSPLDKDTDIEFSLEKNRLPQKYVREITIFEKVSIHIAEADLIALTDIVPCSNDNENVVYILRFGEIQE